MDQKRRRSQTAKKIKALGLSGVGFAEEPKRIYPNGSLLGQTLGFTNIDLKGVEGLEYGFEKMLAGKPATARIRTDGRGNRISDALLNAKRAVNQGKRSDAYSGFQHTAHNRNRT